MSYFCDEMRSNRVSRKYIVDIRSDELVVNHNIVGITSVWFQNSINECLKYKNDPKPVTCHY